MRLPPSKLLALTFQRGKKKKGRKEGWGVAMTTTPADGGEDGEMWEGKLYNYNQFLGEWGGFEEEEPPRHPLRKKSIPSQFM